MQLPLNLKFSAMSDNQRRAVLAWARSHDWGGAPAYWTADNVLRTSCFAWDADNCAFTELASHETLRELRDWAGY